MAYVNLWELITTVAGSKHDLPRREECEEIQKACASGHGHFATELSLEIDAHSWTVKLFNHEDSDEYVSVQVFKDGRVIVTRNRTVEDMEDMRTVRF